MTTEIIIQATDLEDFDDVDIVEILVTPGDEIEKDQSIVTLESDKAMMEFPSPQKGTVKSIEVNVGDKVKQGDALIVISTDNTNAIPKRTDEDNKQESAPVIEDIAEAVKVKKDEKNNNTEQKTITATDIEDFDEVDVVEVLVTPGDKIDKGQSIVTLESDKAMMEFPSPEGGVVVSVAVEVGEKVKQGDVLLVISGDENAEVTIQEEVRRETENVTKERDESASETEEERSVSTEEKTITATDIEDFDEVDVVEVLVTPGDKIDKGQSIVTLESDKAMMEFPSPESGVVVSVEVKVGDKVKQGDALLIVTLQESSVQTDSKVRPLNDNDDAKSDEATNPQQVAGNGSRVKGNPRDSAYASPTVRKYAGELGVNLENVPGTAEKGRVLKGDVQSFVKEHIDAGKTNSVLPNQPLPDFSQFGPIEEVSLNKLRQISAQRLAHSWQTAPHVTQFEEADITDLENARQQLKGQVEEMGAKLSILPFIMKALVMCMAEFEDFNSSINEDVTALIHKKYFHIGIAVDTPRGLLVPVIKDVDQKKIPALAQELLEVSTRARDGKLSPKEMQGGCMSITSLGGIGGQYFTPIVNQPEVAILGVSKAVNKLMKIDGEITERLMLPLSLSYDHRAIDGVAAVKFITSLKNKLSDVWSLML